MTNLRTPIAMSNVYLARGERDGHHVMKIGLAQDVRRRERQIKLRIEHAVTCASREAAHALENTLRRFVIQQGGLRYQSKLDWFMFDGYIYRLLLELIRNPNLATLFPVEKRAFRPERPHELTEDEEIFIYRQRYYRILRGDRKPSGKINQYEEKIEAIRTQHKREIEAIRAQHRHEIDRMKQEHHYDALYKGLEQHFEEQRKHLAELIKLHRRIARLETLLEIHNISLPAG